MEVSPRLLRRKATLFKGVVVALASLAALTVQASPAAADDVCGKQVGGAILVKYIELDRETGPLGCPINIELDNPDGHGKRQEFAGGTIYWSAASGAHPVWGAIGGKWGALGWEGGKLGYPVDDERTNPDGVGKRQQFQGGTVYWHPTLSNGAHPVWGRIGELWAAYGWEGGAFGYPTSDETWDEAYESMTQRFSNDGLALFWSPGDPDDETAWCKQECVGYSGAAGTDWFKETRVETYVGTDHVKVRAIPTRNGFVNARTDFHGAWNQVWSMAPYPKGIDQEEHQSLYEQFACHAAWAEERLPGDWNTGPTWDLESWLPSIGMQKAIDPIEALEHECNWS
ncbi:DUF2599 domain-containing protein [Streptomyces sp. WMMC940]|uniref:DUF2599 domain-containing protein n=1 Tax=Streptomyces sp. WMMC940 TaxID=3015153 RepID=UPI0022B63FFA|nr:DUF2599 domain-containing protein [Streptomyces sp. WMMC940]MCZ7459714.1 DUF2599 domain-containing protein [Streptomyces sp. WMMC940]